MRLGEALFGTLDLDRPEALTLLRGADCKTPEQMTLVNALCRFVELADA